MSNETDPPSSKPNNCCRERQNLAITSTACSCAASAQTPFVQGLCALTSISQKLASQTDLFRSALADCCRSAALSAGRELYRSWCEGKPKTCLSRYNFWPQKVLITARDTIPQHCTRNRSSERQTRRACRTAAVCKDCMVRSCPVVYWT